MIDHHPLPYDELSVIVRRLFIHESAHIEMFLKSSDHQPIFAQKFNYSESYQFTQEG